MLQALLIDFDGVLRIWDEQYDTRAEQATGISEAAIRRVAFVPELLLPVITGNIRDEQWRAQITARLSEQYPAQDAEQAVRVWSEPAGSIDPRVLKLIQRCRKRVKVVLITNASSRLPRDLERLGLTNTFDAVINSSEVGAAKPDAKIYLAALAAGGTTPSSTLLVDDSPGHVEGARRLGILGYVYEGVDQLEKLLQEHGVI